MGRGYSEHDFYCINCGNKGIPVQRRQSHKHKQFHRKKLYCRFCKTEINHIECTTPDEVAEFQINFKNGVYIDEAKASLDFVGNSWVG